METDPAADKFGAFLVANLRDTAIDRVDGLLAAHWKSARLQSLQADLGCLTPEQQAVVRRCVAEAIDGGIHDFLFALGVEHDRGGSIAVIVDGQDVAAQSDGLQGEPCGKDGWYARFSKHGAFPEQA